MSDREDYLKSLREGLVKTAQGVISGETGIILGCRRLQAYRFDLASEHDVDFMLFVGVDSQTDHLPVDEERQNWSSEALVRKDLEIAEAEKDFRDDVLSACHRIIARFDG